MSIADAKHLAVCMPYSLDPDYPSHTAHDNGLEPSDYELQDCPDCGKLMWMGRRVRDIVKGGMPVTCMICAIKVHGVRQNNFKFVNLQEAEEKQA